MLRSIDPNGECPACMRLWRENVVGAISQVVRLCRGPELRGFQCPWCRSMFSKDGEMIQAPVPLEAP